MKKILMLALLLLAINCFAQKKIEFDIEGHRGARGLAPENTIPAFIKGIETGATTLELDVLISKDGKVVVSHDSYFPSAISLDPNGKPISKEREKDFNIYKMTYAEIKQFDVGSLGNRDFPEQQKMPVHKPLLRDVFKAVNKYTRRHKLKAARFNVEIKSGEAGDNIFHPPPAQFAQMVYEEIKRAKMENQVIVQSFDVRPLQEMRRIAPKIPIALLVGDKSGVEKSIARLGFDPDTYSPHFSLLDAATVEFCRASNIRIVPWTVNETVDLERMKSFALDGIITDYPNRAVKMFR